MDIVFSGRSRVDLDGAGYAEAAFDYLDRSARPMAGRIRTELEAWAAAYPESGRGEVVGRLRDRDHHLGALVELFTYSTFTRLGFRLTPHPDVPGTPNHPDFLAERAQDRFYIECTTTKTPPALAGEMRRHWEIVDALKSVASRRWAVMFVAGTNGASTPSRRKFVASVQQWVDAIPEDEWLAERSVEWTWRDGDWFATLVAIPLNDGVEEDHVSGGYVSAAENVEVHRRVRRAVTRKQQGYGADPDLPVLLVVVASDEPFATVEHAVHALYGDKTWNVNMATHEVTESFARNGAWIAVSGLRGQRVSAVLYSHNFGAWCIAESEWLLLPHPGANRPLPLAATGFASVFAVARADGLVTRLDPDRTLREIFGWDGEWPGPESPG